MIYVPNCHCGSQLATSPHSLSFLKKWGDVVKCEQHHAIQYKFLVQVLVHISLLLIISFSN